MTFKVDNNFFGGFAPTDSTIDFYNRINSVLNSKMTVLNLGAGRGAWYFDEKCKYRRELRNIKGKVKKVINADIDKNVMKNRTGHICLLIDENNYKIKLKNNSVDLIIADYVLEHVSNPNIFADEVNRLLKKNGFFCARTPHKFNYVSLFSKLIPSLIKNNLLKKIQPDRKKDDIFFLYYKMNTIFHVKKLFPDYKNYSFIKECDFAYFFGNYFIFKIINFSFKFLPKIFTGNIFFFLKKVK
jgi:SAM-dependent methyltransferase